MLPARAQASAALSPDGREWFLINATPEVTAQLGSFPPLHPKSGIRDTPFRGILLTDGELDHTLGLPQLREGAAWTLFTTAAVRGMLEEHLRVLPTLRRYAAPEVQEVAPDGEVILGPPESRISVRWIETGRDAPRYTGLDEDVPGAVSALLIEDRSTGRSIAYAPGVSRLTDELFDLFRGVEAIWFDGTFWSEDEFPRVSGAKRSARDMGHVPIDGPNGSAEWLAKLPARTKRYVHINNTNPVLDPTGKQRERIRSLGLDLAEDGDELSV